MTDPPDKIVVAGVDISDLVYSWTLVNTTGQARMVELVLQDFDTVTINGRTVAQILATPAS